MNGHVSTDTKINDDFVPTAKLNGAGAQIAMVRISQTSEVTLYSSDEARRYAVAFMQAAVLLDEQDKPISAAR